MVATANSSTTWEFGHILQVSNTESQMENPPKINLDFQLHNVLYLYECFLHGLCQMHLKIKIRQRHPSSRMMIVPF